jgi:fructose-1,6-bisphosphatase/sedoheptulose 1,7-bisphosphatase-like protein
VNLPFAWINHVGTDLRAFGQGDFAYLIATAVSDDHVYTYEAWGPAEDFALALARIEASIKTLKASSGW